jgi:hypothetical protein
MNAVTDLRRLVETAMNLPAAALQMAETDRKPTPPCTNQRTNF